MLSILFALILSSSHALRSTPNLTKADPVSISCDQVTMELPNILGKTEYNTELKMCHDQNFSTVYSQNCQEMKCDLIKQAQSFKESLGFSHRGTPAARLCEKLGGDSLMIYLNQVQAKSSNTGTERKKVHICNKGQDWVSVDFLLSQRRAAKR